MTKQKREICGTMANGDVIYTLYGAAKLLHVSETTLWRLIVRKKIKAGQVGRQWRLLGSVIYEYLGGKKIDKSEIVTSTKKLLANISRF